MTGNVDRWCGGGLSSRARCRRSLAAGTASAQTYPSVPTLTADQPTVDPCETVILTGTGYLAERPGDDHRQRPGGRHDHHRRSGQLHLPVPRAVQGCRRPAAVHCRRPDHLAVDDGLRAGRGISNVANSASSATHSGAASPARLGFASQDRLEHRYVCSDRRAADRDGRPGAARRSTSRPLVAPEVAGAAPRRRVGTLEPVDGAGPTEALTYFVDRLPDTLSWMGLDLATGVGPVILAALLFRGRRRPTGVVVRVRRFVVFLPNAAYVWAGYLWLFSQLHSAWVARPMAHPTGGVPVHRLLRAGSMSSWQCLHWTPGFFPDRWTTAWRTRATILR